MPPATPVKLGTVMASGLAVSLSVGLLFGTVGCTNDAAPDVGPELAPGDLVVSELRGPQTGADDSGQFIELFNASGSDVDLYGLALELYRLDGSARARVIVRGHVDVAASGYATLGPGDAAIQPAYVDYPMGNDLPSALFSSGAVDVFAHDIQIDRVIYGGLPTTGSYSLGELPPTADGNDDAGAWCTDQTLDAADRAIGTPGQENVACN